MTTMTESGASMGSSHSHIANGPEESDPPAIHEVWKLLGDANLLHRCRFEVVPTLRIAHNAVTEGKALVKGDKSFPPLPSLMMRRVGPTATRVPSVLVSCRKMIVGC